MVPNKDTAMDWAEHQRIVCNARHPLASWPPEKHAGKGCCVQWNAAIKTLDKKA